MAIEDSYVVAACLRRYFSDPSTALARYEGIRRERTAEVVRKSHSFRRQAFDAALDGTDAIAASVTQRWQQALARDRLDWLYAYDATALQI